MVEPIMAFIPNHLRLCIKILFMKVYLTVIICAILFLGACVSPTPMASSWSEPTVAKDSTKLFQKILLVAFIKDDAVRRMAEDKMADQVKGRGVQSYNYFTSSDNQSGEDVLNDKLKRDGFDGIVIMRLLPGEKGPNDAPGNTQTANSSWYGYYSNSFPGYVNGNMSTNTVYHIQTNVYSLAANKLLWSGVTTAVNTTDTNRMIDGVIAAVKQKMKQQGLLR